MQQITTFPLDKPFFKQTSQFISFSKNGLDIVQKPYSRDSVVLQHLLFNYLASTPLKAQSVSFSGI